MTDVNTNAVPPDANQQAPDQTQLNPALQASLDQIQNSMQNAFNNTQAVHAVYTAPTSRPLTTDPLHPEHHSDLIDHAENVLSYVSVEVQKHQDLVYGNH